ncbi:hypothetical protein NDU88_006818 [Pleurodeles waltl]|uniref:Uncharacterized protein n=1 Tax=Pleurodeles waltl TaxID=8319 RepID=A0AAV7LQ83_PLEWA|nr:hypothetical protein NDU88_006818 [Pleurodeles waltl]
MTHLPPPSSSFASPACLPTSAAPWINALPVPNYTGELAMPGGRTASKQPGKLSWQLLFSEALRHQRVLPAVEHPLTPPSSMVDTTQGTTMDRILQEISAVGRKLEVWTVPWLR